MRQVRRRRLAWACSAAGVAAAYLIVVIPEHGRVASLLAQAQRLYAAANSDEQTVALEPAIRKALQRVHDETLLLADQTSAAEMVTALEQDGRKNRVRITAIDLGAPGATPPPPVADAIESREINVSIEGTYAGIVGFVSDLSGVKPLFGVDSLALASDTSGTPVLRAVLSVALYNLNMKRRGGR